ncbi:hypothetical protein JTE90_007842 [Oedothorax gibbosus]|uniref:Uncharacterized protein n=1 Tax=Oedothorax gibbosus TaxID=931172 RepID=A0AAV6VKM2_9ARAC|nr:hypothetical protein JTE90_007842 [Oedothorax gibbosus]
MSTHQHARAQTKEIKEENNRLERFSRGKLSEPRDLSPSSWNRPPHSLAVGHSPVTWGFPARLVVNACLCSCWEERERNKLFLLLSIVKSERGA